MSADLKIVEVELDANLKRAVKRTSVMRQGFYVVVLLVALAGQVSGAMEMLNIPLAAAIPAFGALELAGIVVLANADVRRRLGERAIASRLLSALIAAGAVAFNWLAHSNHLLGGFFATMSALGYLVWLMHTENQRRDRLRAKGALPPVAPAYEVFGHWVSHPWLTRRARAMAKADPRLGLYESLAAARAEVRRQRRQKAISKVLHRKIRAAVDPSTADIAIAVYDLDEIAGRLAENADYDGLTALIATDLAPARLAPELAAELAAGAEAAETATAAAAGAGAGAGAELPHRVRPALQAPADAAYDPTPVLPPSVRRDLEDWLGARQSITAEPDVAEGGKVDGAARRAASPAETTMELPIQSGVAVGVASAPAGSSIKAGTAASGSGSAQPAAGSAQPVASGPGSGSAQAAVAAPAAVPAAAAAAAAAVPESETQSREQVQDGLARGQVVPVLHIPTPSTPKRRDGSLRSRVHATLDSHAATTDEWDRAALMGLVTDALNLTDDERSTAATYVRTWMRDKAARRRSGAPRRQLQAAMSGDA